jgi:hypothetical protein
MLPAPPDPPGSAGLDERSRLAVVRDCVGLEVTEGSSLMRASGPAANERDESAMRARVHGRPFGWEGGRHLARAQPQ